MLVLLFPCLFVSGQPIQTGRQELSTFSAGLWHYFETNDKQTPINSIIKTYSSGAFKPINQTILNAGIPNQYYWLHFSITNSEDVIRDLIVDIDNARLNELELFKAANNSARSLGKLGDFYPFSQRPVLHKNFIYQDTLLANQTKEYFLFVNQVGHTFTLPVKIFSAKNFRSSTFRDYLFDGITYGILLFVAIVSFLFFFTSRSYLYLYYGLYILTAIVWFLSYFGLGYQYIWGDYPSMNTAMAPALASLNIVLNLQICQVLLKLAKINRSINRLANITKGALIAIALFPLFCNLNLHGYTVNHTYLIVFLFTILFAMVIVSFSVILYSVRGFIEARFYLIASLLKALSIVNLALLELGITPAVYNMEGFLQAGIFIEITLLTYALAARYTHFKTSTFARVIEAHENERTLISQEIHDCISNSLTGINIGIENLTKDVDQLPADKKMHLEKLHDELIKVQAEARNISHNTMPDYVKNNSITEIVKIYVEEIQNKVKNNPKDKNCIQINFSANKQLFTFSEAVKLNIFRIIQEILANILKHSKATTADILFSFSKKEMTIIAEDNGVGFDQINDDKKGMGLKNISTRVELLEGNLAILSPAYKQNCEQTTMVNQIGCGTLVKIKVPYRNNLLKNTKLYDY